MRRIVAGVAIIGVLVVARVSAGAQAPGGSAAHVLLVPSRGEAAVALAKSDARVIAR